MIDLLPRHATKREAEPEPEPGAADGTTTVQHTALTKPILTGLHAKDLEQCIMVAPVLPGSAMLSEMVDCLVIVGAQQVRKIVFFFPCGEKADFQKIDLFWSSLEYIRRQTQKCC